MRHIRTMAFGVAMATGLAGLGAATSAASPAAEAPTGSTAAPIVGTSATEAYTGDFASLQTHPTPQWWKDDKFGIFIHWGPYSVPAWGPPKSYAEWYGNYLTQPGSATNTYHQQTYGTAKSYDSFADDWTAKSWDPAAWVKLFQDAGAKYFVLTSKHHDGWALWDTTTSTRNTVAHGPKRDLVGELFAAGDAAGLKKGLYYSNYEWFNPNYTGKQPTNPYTGQQIPYTGVTSGQNYVTDYMLPQMNELIDNYQPDILWCDGEWDRDASYWQMGDTIAHYYNSAAAQGRDVAVNNRCRVKPGPDYRGEQLDFQTPEYQGVNGIQATEFESSRGIGYSYGLNKNEPVSDYLSSQEIVHDLVDVVSKNGNLLLDVGPDADGVIPEAQASRLRDTGGWLKTNGEAIYGTTTWKRNDEPASSTPVRYTLKNTDLYATAFGWPGQTLALGADVPTSAATKITLLGNDTPLTWTRDASGKLLITTPANGASLDPLGAGYAFKISNSTLPNLAKGSTATQSSTAYGADAARAVDGNENGLFAGGSVTHTLEPSKQAWWQTDLGASHPIGELRIFNRTDSCCAARLSNYWLLTSDHPITGDTLAEAQASPGVTVTRQSATAGSPTTLNLAGRTARYVRIQLESGTDPLSLAEVEAYAPSETSGTSGTTAGTPSTKVVPELTRWQAGSGTFTFPTAATLSYPAGQANTSTTGATEPGQSPQTVSQLATAVATDYAAITGVSITPVADTPSPALALSLVNESALGAQGYRLTVTSSGATIAANTTAGLYYGTRTVLQMLRGASDKLTLAVGAVTDVPLKSQRWFGIDAARKYYSPEYIKDIIREMGWQKLNMFQLHIVEPEGFRLYSPDLPIGSPTAAYTKEQVAEFVALGHANHVQVVPGFEFPGHADPVSKHFNVGMEGTCGQEYVYGWVKPNFAMNIMKPEALAAATTVLDEYAGWFDSPYVHLGADEMPPGLPNCPTVKDFLAAHSGTYSTWQDVFNDFVNKLDAHTRSLGKTSIIYNGFEHNSAPKIAMSTNVIVMDYLGDGTSPSLAAYTKIQAGPPGELYVVANHAANLYGGTQWAYNSWQPSSDPKILGGIAHVWNDYLMFSQDSWAEQFAAPLRAATGNALWRGTSSAAVADFTATVASIGHAPGWRGASTWGGADPTTPTTNGAPTHTYTFDPAAYPDGWNDGAPGMNVRPILDGVGSLHMSTEIQIQPLPSYVEGRAGHGKAMQFNGSGDVLGIGGSDLTGPWTMSLWVRKDATLTDSNLLGSYAGNIKLDQYNTGKVGFTRVGVTDWSFNYAVPTGTWTQLTLVSDGTNTTLYANGAKQQTIAATIPLPRAYFGQRNGTTLKGAVDDLALYNQALTDAQVQAAYDASR